METLAARMDPFPGRERTLASLLEGLGFDVFRIDETFLVRAPKDLWHGIFNHVDPLTREVIVPNELADLVIRIVFVRPRFDADSD